MTDGTANSPGPAGLRGNAALAAQIALIAGLVAALYFALWRDLHSFVVAVDRTHWIFNDFRFHFHPTAAALFRTGQPTAGYFYSAFFALLLWPLGALGVEAAAFLWGLIEVLACVALFFLPLARLLRLNRRGVVLYFALTILSFPLLHNFKWGQVSVLLALCTVAAFDASSRKRSVGAGLLLALAASMKYYSGWFILYFVLRKDWRALAAFLGFGLLFFVLVPAAALGPETWWSFQRSTMGELGASDWIRGDVNSQYFAHVVSRWMNNFTPPVGPLPAWLAASGGALALINVAAVWRGRRDGSAEGAMLACALLFTSLPFLIRTSWPHYFVYLPICQAATLHTVIRIADGNRWKLAAGSILPALSILVSSVPFFAVFPSWAAYEEKGWLFIANAALIPVLVWLSFRNGGAAGPPEGGFPKGSA